VFPGIEGIKVGLEKIPGLKRKPHDHNVFISSNVLPAFDDDDNDDCRTDGQTC